MSRSRDTQRSKVYDAERLVRTIFDRADENGLRSVEVMGSHVTLPIERKFASIESVQTYVDAVLALNWTKATWPHADRRIYVRERSGNGAAHYEHDTATIAVPMHQRGKAWALRELVVLHEVAHHFHEERQAHHGGEFVERYIALVTEIVGSEAGFLLRVMMVEAGAAIG